VSLHIRCEIAVHLSRLSPLLTDAIDRLCGYTPFRSDDPAKLAAETQKGKIEFRKCYESMER